MIAGLGIVPLSIDASPAGQLSHFIANWRLVTKDRSVLNTVMGDEIEFVSQPHQSKKPNPAYLNQTQQQLVSPEISELCLKRAMTELKTPLVGGFVSTLFLVPKKDGGQRPCSDQSRKRELLCRHPTLQNGGNSHPQYPIAEGGLASEDRSKRCILFCPSQSGPQEIPVFPSRRQTLPVQLPPLWPM